MFKLLNRLRSWASGSVRGLPDLLLVYFGRSTNTSQDDTNMPLTDAKVRALKAKPAPYKLSDGEGLFVFVPTGGSRLWRFAYRYLGKQKILALGRYPDVTLLEARRARDQAKSLLAKGVDPSTSRKAEKREKLIAAGNTFEAVADEWFETNNGRWVPSYSCRLRSRLDDDLMPALGKRPIAEIEPADVLDAIRKIEGRDAIEMAKRVMQMASAIFRFGVATSRCRRDPTADLKGALRPAMAAKRRTALPAAELVQFMQDLERYDGDIVTRLGLKLIVLTFVRTSELRFARWSEFEGLDGPEPMWRIPEERMKMRRPHLVPLSVGDTKGGGHGS
jgi:hypothetical protein